MPRPHKLTPSWARAELRAQHAGLRAQIARCARLAEQLDAEAIAPDAVIAAIVALRAAFEVHNQLEERLLRPLLHDAARRAGVRIARLLDDHVDEHEAIRCAFTCDVGSTTTTALRDVLANLSEHLAAEERGFLSCQPARDDPSE